MAAADEGAAAIHRAYELHRAGRSQEAVGHLVAAIRQHPRSLGLLRLLADVQRSLGRRGAEAAALEELTCLDPLSGETWRRLASVRAEMGRLEDAYLDFRQATELDPEDGAAWEGLCRAALSTQRIDAAERAVRELARCRPGRSGELLLGHIRKARGLTEEAKAAYESVIAEEDVPAEALFNRIDLEVPAASDALAQRVESLLARVDLEDVDRGNLSFAEARILERAGRYERAFSLYRSANQALARALSRRGVQYRPSQVENWVAQTRSAYPAGSFGRPLEPLPIDLRLIFIVGMPRSGTSLVEQILASHGHVAGGGELALGADCERIHRERRGELGLSGPFNPADERERALLMETRERYVDRLLELDLDAEWVTDKAPGNFASLGLLRLMFPDARIVSCRRNPLATCWSLFTANFAQHDPYYHSLEHLRHYYGCHERLMSHWCEVLVPRPAEVRYEDLVARPEQEIRRLLEAVGLEWDARCLEFHENPRPVLTASHAEVRRPIHTRSVERWRPFEPWLEELRDMMQ